MERRKVFSVKYLPNLNMYIYNTQLFFLEDHRIKVFLNDDFKNLDLLLRHKGLVLFYPCVKMRWKEYIFGSKGVGNIP